MYTVEYLRFRRFNVWIPLYDTVFKWIVDKNSLVPLIKFLKWEFGKYIPEHLWSEFDYDFLWHKWLFFHNWDYKIKLKDITVDSIDSNIRKYWEWYAQIYYSVAICTYDCWYIRIQKLHS